MPIVALKMGPTLNPEDIKEGDGVYFECDIKSNPKPYKMTWFHDVSIYYEYILWLSIFYNAIRDKQK